MNRNARIRFGLLSAMLLLCMVGHAACAAGANLGAQTSNPSSDAGDDDTGSVVVSDGGEPPGFDFDAPTPCVGLACQQVKCPGENTTSVSGRVFAPNGVLPLYNVIVYVPNAPLEPMAQGVKCDQCGTVASGNPIVTTLSDPAGEFVLKDVPAGTNIPLVVQLGKWRRQTIIPVVTSCADTALTDPNLTRLPKNQQEGSMPHIALTTGGCDSIGCMIGKLGIDTTEFGVQSDGYQKAINVYSSAGDSEGTLSEAGAFSDGFTNTTPASALWGNLTLLRTYDMGVFSCECDESLATKGVPANQIAQDLTPASLPASADFANVTDYLNAGGRIFTTDFQYTWYRYSPDPKIGATMVSKLSDTGLGIVPGGAPMGHNPLTLNTSFPKGLALSQWLAALFGVGPLSGIPFDSVWDNVSSLSASPQLWATADSVPNIFTVDTPVGLPATQQCGKGVHIDAHITDARQGDQDFVGCNNAPGPVGSAACYPNTCTGAFKEDEAAFAFFFFDLASCIQNEGAPPQPPPPTPK
jgi:hypothetical protein